MSGEPLPPRPTTRAYDPGADFEGMFAVTREIVSLPPYEEARRELAAYPAKEVVARVAEVEGQGIVGYCAASHPYWNAVAILDYVVVAPGHRGRGLGARLVHEVERDLSRAGVRRVCVQTISWNSGAIRFYERLGYTVRARLPRYFDEAHDLVWLDRELDRA